MKFTKMHGIGNDYVYVNGFAERVADPGDVARKVSDRHFGIGSDGLIMILPSDKADVRMRMFNADGSEGEMCGNGIRCVAKELYERGGVHNDRIAIDTGAGRLLCAIDAERDVVHAVTVDMGAPRLLRGEIPMTGPANERCVEQPLSFPDQTVTLSITGVSMGNPHAVTFVDGDLRKLADALGVLVEHHKWFPKRTNAEFARVKSAREIDLVVWERGVGITLACGTGACATVVAAVITGRCAEATEVLVHLPGGDLVITVERGMSSVLMRGPALHVFDGELDPRRVAPRP